MSPEQCVRNFSDTGHCADEKAAERDQIEANRQDFQILSAIMVPETIAFDVAMIAGSVEGPCQFEDIPRSGAQRRPEGIRQRNLSADDGVRELPLVPLREQLPAAVQHNARKPEGSRAGPAALE